MWRVYLLMFVVVLVVSILWVRGIDYMDKNHPDYKGEDFFNEEEERKDYDEN
jgi:hypothetical protein